jgi:molybdate transport system regulatory protein
MSYRRAWMLVREINTTFAKPLVFTARGGKGGGGVVGLTPFSEEVLKRHRRMEKSTAKVIAVDLKILNRTATASKR